MNTTGISTMETASEMPEPSPVDPIQIFIHVLTVLTVVLILIFNPTCLVVLYRASGIQETTKVFMAALTISDICVGLFWVLPELTANLAGEWLLGEFLCSVWGVAAASFFTLSFLSLVLLTVDRFLAIVYSLRYPTLMTPTKAKLTVATTWTLTLAFYIILMGIYAPNTLSQESPRICSYGQCIFCLYQSVFMMAISIGTISILYFYILNVARQQARRIAAQNQISVPQGEQQRVSTKSATTVFIITLTVFACWTPTICLFVIIPQMEQDPSTFILIANVVFHSNSWLNIVIYYLRNKVLRQRLHELVGACYHQVFG